MTSEHRYGVPERLEPSNKRNSNFATCLAASPVAISFLCLLVVTPVRSSLSLFGPVYTETFRRGDVFVD